jgi:hypothetical protein
MDLAYRLMIYIHISEAHKNPKKVHKFFSDVKKLGDIAGFFVPQKIAAYGLV